MAEARKDLAGGKLGENNPYALITVAAGEHSARATIAWAKDALASLDPAHQEPVTSPPDAGT